MYKLYYLTSILDCNLPRYVGYTTELNRRLEEHINEGKYSKSRSHKINWISSILKRGAEPKIILLDEFSDLESTLEAERFYVEHFNLWFNLTNSTSGGEISKTIRIDVREKISKKVKEYFAEHGTWNKGLKYNFSKERNQKRREKMGDKISGENNHFFGKNHRTETRKILSQKNRIHDYTYEQIFDLYIRENLTGMEISEKINIPYIAIKKAIRRWKLKDIKKEIYGKIKGNKDVKKVDFEVYFDNSMF